MNIFNLFKSLLKPVVAELVAIEVNKLASNPSNVSQVAAVIANQIATNLQNQTK